MNDKIGNAVTIGDFDGLHIGHMALLARLREEAERLSLNTAVISFPGNTKTQKTLYAPDEKRFLLEQNGVNNVWMPDFSKIKNISACDFVSEIIEKRFNARVVVCGEDFRFGANASGDVNLLQSLLKPYSASLVVVKPVMQNGKKVSSSEIRELIAAGKLEEATLMLGRDYSFLLPVCEGARLGRKLGYPTINQLYPTERVVPKAGVYAVLVELMGKTFGGVANIGVKPTVTDEGRVLCETYIFGFDGDAYGKEARIILKKFLRSEKRFASIEELRMQIERDAAAAKTALTGI